MTTERQHISRTIAQIGGFFRGHWPHLLAAIPLGIAFTALHELAHSAAVWLQGGTVTAFAWWPSGAEWGHMSYSFPVGAQYSKQIILLAPYVLYLGMNLLAGLMALWRRALPFPVASSVFVWLFIVPVADFANTAVPYALWGTFNDFNRALGPSSPSVSAALLSSGFLASWYGYWLNRRLYGPLALGVPSYCALAAAGMGIVVAINSIWLV